MQHLICKICFVFLVIIMIKQHSNAQNLSDSTIKLSTVTVFDSKINQQQGLKTSSIDSALISEQINASLADLLSSFTAVFIKSYGQGNLATASFRGTSASHTRVLWNDVSINSPMIGQMDFSMIPVFFMDDLKLMYGGSSMSGNSGGLGGSINITNKRDKEKLKIQYIQQFGSFSSYASFLNVGFSLARFQSRTRIMYLNSENNFIFKNNTIGSSDFPLEIRKDAGYSQYGILQEFYYQPFYRDEVSLKIWLQENKRDIPQPLVVTPLSENEKQKNTFLRAIALWKHYYRKGKIETNISYFHDFLNYTNKIAYINSDNTVDAISGKIKYSYEFSPELIFTSGSSFEFNFVNSNNYSGLKNQKLYSAFAGFTTVISKRLFANFIVRQELNNTKLLPLLPSLGVDYKIFEKHNLILKTHISKNYHLPSLNDLYWYPGGNPNLLPENGYSAESGLVFETNAAKKLTLKAEAGCFYTHITNWILWQPDPVFRYWTPINLKEVTSKGIELSSAMRYVYKQLIISLNIIYSFTSAKNLKPINQNDHTIDKQLIYTPSHSLNMSFHAEWKNYFTSYSVHYTGERFTNTSNTRYMPDYSTNDVVIGSNYKFKNNKVFTFQVNINNLLDADYQAIAWQPMPGRNIEILLKFDITKK